MAQTPGVVLITLGGNDAHFTDVVGHCFAAANCVTDGSADKAITQAGSITGALTNALVALRAKAPIGRTKIYILGHPKGRRRLLGDVDS